MFELIKQHDIKDCGAACLGMILRFYNLKLPMAKLRELVKVDNNGASIYGIADGAEKTGLKATALQGNCEDFLNSVKNKEFSFPVIARIIIDEILEHYVVIYKIKGNSVYIADPGKGKVKYSLKDFFDIWTGHIIVFEKTSEFKEGNECKGTLKRFLKLITKQKGLLISVFVISLIIAFIGVAGTFIFGIIIDGIENQDFYLKGGLTIGRICFGLIILYLFQMLMNILRGYFLSVLSKNVDMPLMLNYYNHMMDLPLKDLDGRKTGELMSRFNDASTIKEAISGAALSFMLDTLMVLICISILYTLNPFLFLIALTIVLVYGLVAVCFLNPIKSINEKIMEENAEVTSYIKETVDGIATIKAFGIEKTVKEKTRLKFAGLIKSSMKGSVYYIIQDSLSGMVASVGVVILLWIGTIFVMNNTISLGTLITFYSMLGYFLNPIQNLIGLQPELQTALVAADRLNDILELEKEEETSGKSVIGYDIEIKNVDFRYGNRELVLKNINMSIKSGECIALVGESGSGKTTLAKLLMAFYKPENGEIRIGDKDISTLNPKDVRDNAAYIAQDIFLFSDSIKNNLSFGNPDISTEEIKNACKLSTADEFIKRLPMGYNTFIGENGHDLSGGQRQRLAIARALIKTPKILIMDEATGNLDTITEKSIKETIDNLSGEITTIIIAHRLSTIRNCDRIYVMDRGEIAEFGTHDELLAMNGLYKKFYLGDLAE